MFLSEAKKGKTYKLITIFNNNISAQALRFGLFEGEKISCFEIIPNGPIIILKNNQEIAIGRDLANKIEIENT